MLIKYFQVQPGNIKQGYGVNGSMRVSKTLGVGSNPTTPAIL